LRYFICIYVLHPYKKNLRIFPPVCFCLRGSWFQLRLQYRANKLMAGSRVFYFSRSLNCTLNLGLTTSCLWRSQFPSSVVITGFKSSHLPIPPSQLETGVHSKKNLALWMLFFCCCGIRVWTQDLTFPRKVLYHLSHSTSPRMFLRVLVGTFICPIIPAWKDGRKN
jgi:hypothetical protein